MALTGADRPPCRYGCEMFMCQHCPGCCNADLPGGYEWTETPSSYDGTLPWQQMYTSTPPEYVGQGVSNLRAIGQVP